MQSETLYNSFVMETYHFAIAAQHNELSRSKGLREGELVMDVGCGVNQISTDFISQRYIDAKKMYIDNDPEVIKYFSKKNTSHEYAQIDILDWNKLQAWEGSVSKVVALRCLSEVEDQKTAFEIIFRLLRPGGDILIIMTINSLFYDLLNIITQKERWKEYFKEKHVVPESHRKNFNATYYRNLLQCIGFEQVSISEVPRIVTYTNDTEFRDDAFHSSAIRFVPEIHRQEFALELTTFAEFHRFKTNSNGYLDIKSTTLWIFAVKPDPLVILS